MHLPLTFNEDGTMMFPLSAPEVIPIEKLGFDPKNNNVVQNRTIVVDKTIELKEKRRIDGISTSL